MFFARNLEIQRFRTNLRRLYLAAIVLFTAPDPALYFVGTGLVAAGVLVHFWASGYLTRGKTLVAAGPYALVRNPFYSAAVVIDLGFGLASRNWIALGVFLPVITAVYLRRIQGEEKALAASFGPEYEAYMRFCPSRLVPRIWNLWRTPPGPALAFSFSTVLRNREPGRAGSHAVVVAIAGLPMLWAWPWESAPLPARFAALGVLALALAAMSVRTVPARAVGAGASAPAGPGQAGKPD